MNHAISHNYSGERAEEASGHVPSSGQWDGVSGQQKSGPQRPGCKELHVSSSMRLSQHAAMNP